VTGHRQNAGVLKMLYKIAIKAGCQLLTPVILASQKGEIRRIMVQSQPGQIVRETLSQKQQKTKTKTKQKKKHKKELLEWLKW
jgi:predicted DNA-binding antitoxin AbrB/MazE fold protein